MKSGEMKCWQKGNMGALVWKDRRLVYMLTTHVSPKTTQWILRKGQSKKERVPSVVLDYNKFKGGVDTVDQLRDSYSMGRKSLKWWPRLAWWCIDMCIVNAYSLHCMNASSPMTHLQFRERLMHQLLEKYGEHQRSREDKRQRIARPHLDQHQLVLEDLSGIVRFVAEGDLDVNRPHTNANCVISFCVLRHVTTSIVKLESWSFKIAKILARFGPIRILRPVSPTECTSPPSSLTLRSPPLPHCRGVLACPASFLRMDSRVSPPFLL